MNWSTSILIGVLTGLFGAVHGFFVAYLAVHWLRISAFEGGSSYFVVLAGLAAFVLGLFAGIAVSRLLGGPGWFGFAHGMGWSFLVVGGMISAIGVVAWLVAEREPTVGGQPIGLMVEISLPTSVGALVLARPETPSIVLYSGDHAVGEALYTNERLQRGDRWVLSSRINIPNTSHERVVAVMVHAVPEQYFDLPLAGRPELMAQWSDWLIRPTLSDGSPPPADAAFSLRYRVVMRDSPGQAPRR